MLRRASGASETHQRHNEPCKSHKPPYQKHYRRDQDRRFKRFDRALIVLISRWMRWSVHCLKHHTKNTHTTLIENLNRIDRGLEIGLGRFCTLQSLVSPDDPGVIRRILVHLQSPLFHGPALQSSPHHPDPAFLNRIRVRFHNAIELSLSDRIEHPRAGMPLTADRFCETGIRLRKSHLALFVDLVGLLFHRVNIRLPVRRNAGRAETTLHEGEQVERDGHRGSEFGSENQSRRDLYDS